MVIIYLAFRLPGRSMRSTRLYSDERRTTCMNLHPVRFTLLPTVTGRDGGLLPRLFTFTFRSFSERGLTLPSPPGWKSVFCGTFYPESFRDLPVRKHGSRWCSDFPHPDKSGSDYPETLFSKFQNLTTFHPD